MSRTEFSHGEEERLRESLEELAAGLGSGLTKEELTHMSRVATSQEARPRWDGLWRRRAAIVAVAAAALLILSAPLVAGIDRLLETARKTGVEEEVPPGVQRTFSPAEVPYISVQPLMHYLGTHLPVVPSAAVTERSGDSVVFVVVERPAYEPTGKSVPLIARARRVAVDRSVGKAVLIRSGLTPCDLVVVDPPASLSDGDTIRSYSGETAEGPNIDFGILFGGRAPAPAPPIEGGIAREIDGTVILSIVHHGGSPKGVPPAGSFYRYRAPDGTERRVPYGSGRAGTNVPYDSISEVGVPKNALRTGEPVGTVQLVSPSRQILASGQLEWYCAAYAPFRGPRD